MIAGPTDSLILADSSADPFIVATDLVGQAEHGYNSPVWLVTSDAGLAEKVMHRPLSESSALVIGGGAIGLLAALFLAQKGTARIMLAETSVSRRKTAENVGCCEVFDPLGAGLPTASGFDLVVDAVGSGATRKDASKYVRQGGVITHIGLQDNEPGLDIRRLTLQEITFIGNYTYTH